MALQLVVFLLSLSCAFSSSFQAADLSDLCRIFLEGRGPPIDMGWFLFRSRDI